MLTSQLTTDNPLIDSTSTQENDDAWEAFIDFLEDSGASATLTQTLPDPTLAQLAASLCWQAFLAGTELAD